MLAPAKKEFEFQVKVDRVVDGDTFDSTVTVFDESLASLRGKGVRDLDVGFKIHVCIEPDARGVLRVRVKLSERFRMYGINAPETRSLDAAEKKAGIESAAWLRQEVEGKTVLLATHKGQEKYGRWLGVITDYLPDSTPRVINDLMVKLGLAKPFMLDK